MMYLGHVRGTATYNLDDGPARPDFELFDPNGHAGHSWVSQKDRRDAFGKHLDERDMLLRDDHSDRIGEATGSLWPAFVLAHDRGEPIGVVKLLGC